MRGRRTENPDARDGGPFTFMHACRFLLLIGLLCCGGCCSGPARAQQPKNTWAPPRPIQPPAVRQPDRKELEQVKAAAVAMAAELHKFQAENTRLAGERERAKAWNAELLNELARKREEAKPPAVAPTRPPQSASTIVETLAAHLNNWWPAWLLGAIGVSSPFAFAAVAVGRYFLRRKLLAPRKPPATPESRSEVSPPADTFRMDYEEQAPVDRDLREGRELLRLHALEGRDPLQDAIAGRLMRSRLDAFAESKSDPAKATWADELRREIDQRFNEVAPTKFTVKQE